MHDLAPGAQLRFANIETYLEFNAAVNALAAVCDVVVDDIGFFGWPGDGTSPVSRNTAEALTNPAHRVRTHVTATGNEARDHYEDAYRVDAQDISAGFSSTRGKLRRFEGSPGTSDRAGVGASSLNNMFRLAPGASASVWLTWNDPIGASANDYELVILRRDAGGTIEQWWEGLSIQDGDDDPRESVLVTNTTGAEAQFDILVWNKGDTAAARTIELFVYGALHAYTGGAALGWLTPGGSIIA